MTKELLQTKSKDEVFDFIRERLKFRPNIESQLKYIDKEIFKKEHRRFEMSGYEDNVGECTIHNLSIVNEFADLGIYDYTNYLFLDFYKGNGVLYLQYLNQNENLAIDLGGLGTIEIIYELFQNTIFSKEQNRRRI